MFYFGNLVYIYVCTYIHNKSFKRISIFKRRFLLAAAIRLCCCARLSGFPARGATSWIMQASHFSGFPYTWALGARASVVATVPGSSSCGTGAQLPHGDGIFLDQDQPCALHLQVDSRTTGLPRKAQEKVFT